MRKLLTWRSHSWLKDTLVTHLQIKNEVRGKKIIEQLLEHDYLRHWKIPPFSPLLRSRGKQAQISNPINNHVLESYSYIFFTLYVLYFYEI